MQRHATIAERVIITGLFAAVLVLAATPHGEAAVAPLSPAELRERADVVVVAKVTGIEIVSERSRVESGFGNYDWGVYCTLLIQEVEKGDVRMTSEQIVARCFVVKLRKSLLECFGAQSHELIPEVGQQVRAHLLRVGSAYQVVHPNGFTSAGQTPLMPSATVAGLKGGFTFWLPLELWLIGAVLTSVTACLVVNARRILIRWRAVRDPDERFTPRYSLRGLLAITSCAGIGIAAAQYRLASWLGMVAFLALIWFTFRPPSTVLGRRVWWGINVAFGSSIVTLVVCRLALS